MIIREPFRWLLQAFIDRCGMQADMLVIHNILPTFSISHKEFRIKAPCYNRIEHQFISIVDQVSFWNFYKTPLIRVEPDSDSSLAFGIE